MKNEKDRFASKLILASKFECTPDNLKEAIFAKFRSLKPTIEDLKKVINKHQASKDTHAQAYDMQPDDTPAGIMVEYLEQYLQFLQNEEKGIVDFLAGNQDFKDQLFSAFESGDMDLAKKIIGAHPELIDKFIEMLAKNEENSIDNI